MTATDTVLDIVPVAMLPRVNVVDVELQLEGCTPGSRHTPLARASDEAPLGLLAAEGTVTRLGLSRVGGSTVPAAHHARSVGESGLQRVLAFISASIAGVTHTPPISMKPEGEVGSVR